MLSQLTPVAVFYFFVAAIGALTALVAWRHRATPGAVPLAGLMAATALWSLADGLERMAPAFETKIAFAKLAHVGIQSVAVLFLIFVCRYTGKDRWLTRRRIALLWLMPLITLALVFTNEAHHLIWIDMYITPPYAGNDSVYVHGTWFWLAAVYSYSLLLAGTVLLTGAIIEHREEYRRIAVVLLVALAVPWISNLVYLSPFNPLPGLDWTSISFVVTGTLVALAVFYLRLFDLAPIARSALFDKMSDALLVLNGENRVVDANPAAFHLLTSPHELLGSPIDQLFGDIQGLEPLIQGPLDGHGTIILHGKQPRWLDALLTPLSTPDGQPRGRLIVLRDITERVRMEEELGKARVGAEAATLAKNEFLAMMSHELRTPLASMLGLTEVLLSNAYGTLNAKQLRSLDLIEDSGRHLAQLISDILDLTSAEAGGLGLEITACVAADVCAASVRLLEPVILHKEQHLTWSVTPPDVVLQADPRRLKQMLVNLLDNASKFTPEGGQVGLAVSASPAQQAILFVVWDTGIGIAREDEVKLFEPFVQVDSSLARRFGGAGLGLTLVQRLAALHGGTVTMESKPGEGSRFTITLPWNVDPQEWEDRYAAPEEHSAEQSAPLDDQPFTLDAA